uniref:Uncharacterized protein n=1 Tax=Cuerna arida TaxID=1464854 RepID=A0A1B6EXD0_9HEMI
MLLLRCLLLSLLAALVCAQEPAPTPTSTEDTQQPESGTPPSAHENTDMTNPLIADTLEPSMPQPASTPEKHNETSPVMNITVNPTTEIISTTPNTTTQPSSAATELGFLSGVVLCLISAHVLS